MDGFQGRLKDSLQLRLSLWLALIILGVALVAGAVSFFVAFNEANELQDDMLRQTAALFNAQHLPAPHTGDKARPSDNDPDTRLIVALVPKRVHDRSNPEGPGFPPGLANGIQTLNLNNQTYRIFVRSLGAAGQIAVAQQTAVRNETARNSALQALWPFLILVPILLLVVTGLVRTMFAPVAAVAVEVDQRGDQDLQPIATGTLPGEIRPFVVAINRLLGRVAESMAMQRRFIAAAAHELRSPLTALSLQAERLAGAEMAESAQQRLSLLRQGIERNRALLDQLLTFARAQATLSTATAAVSVQYVFRRVLEDLMPLAEAKGLDIGVASKTDAWVVVSEVDLTTAVKNLVTNAIRYTLPGGRIDLTITEAIDAVAVAVEDNGPGIAEADRARVFEPFHRALDTDVVGSGLGLSIVKTVVERFRGRVVLADASRSATGLRVTVTIPKSRPDSTS